MSRFWTVIGGLPLGCRGSCSQERARLPRDGQATNLRQLYLWVYTNRILPGASPAYGGGAGAMMWISMRRLMRLPSSVLADASGLVAP